MGSPEQTGTGLQHQDRPEGVRYDLVVSLGTDHHHFDRLIDWVDEYTAAHPDLQVLVQHGFTRRPARGESVERMPREDLLELYRGASVVLVQGGPGSILDARETGVVPIAVPRRSDLDEVVDDHQIAFSRVMADIGDAEAVETKEALFAALDRALAKPEELRTEPRVPQNEQAAEELSGAISLMLSHPTPRSGRFLRRVLQVIRSAR